MDESERMRQEMENKLNINAQEQVCHLNQCASGLSLCGTQMEYQAVTCDLRAKLEKELRELQKEHAQAEEENGALMEDRVNLIAQLTETKIQAQETLQKTITWSQGTSQGLSW